MSELALEARSGQRVNQNGQRIGAKGQRTRQRLIDVTIELLRTHGLRDLTVAEVARVAQTSPATFYVYFPGVPEVVLSALEDAQQTSPRLLELLDEDWIGEDGLARARRFVEIYCELWQQHVEVFRIRNLAAEEGDARFREAQIDAARAVLDRLAGRLERARQAGRITADVNCKAAAGAILILLERLSAVAAIHDAGEGFGVADLQRSAADMVAHAMGAFARGNAPAGRAANRN